MNISFTFLNKQSLYYANNATKNGNLCDKMTDSQSNTDKMADFVNINDVIWRSCQILQGQGRTLAVISL